MKITNVQTIYVKLPQIKQRADSGQDALLVIVDSDAGIRGLGEVDSAPLAVKGVIEAPYSHAVTAGLRELLIGEDPFETEKLWHKMYTCLLYTSSLENAAAFLAVLARFCKSLARPRQF